MKNPIPFIMRRLNERSTIVFIIAGVGAASALPAPYSYVSIALSVFAAMIPDGPVAPVGPQ